MFEFPAELHEALEREASGLKPKELAQAAEELSQWYRSGRVAGLAPRWRPAHYLAYAATRMPATFAAVSAAFEELTLRAPLASIESMLDLCSGPGTALWAAAACFPQLTRAQAVELSAGFMDLAQKLARGAGHPALDSARFGLGEVSRFSTEESFDLVSVSYGLGELAPQSLSAAVQTAWRATARALVIVEPGTPAGFATILECRRTLIELGAHIAAPCPHAAECPMAGGGQTKWCHFTQRLARSRMHRLTKGVELGYEDEKYSYVIVTREPVGDFGSRIVGHPRQSKPGISLELCTPEGLLRQLMVARRQKHSFAQARRARWGETWKDEAES